MRILRNDSMQQQISTYLPKWAMLDIVNLKQQTWKDTVLSAGLWNNVIAIKLATNLRSLSEYHNLVIHSMLALWVRESVVNCSLSVPSTKPLQHQQCNSNQSLAGEEWSPEKRWEKRGGRYLKTRVRLAGRPSGRTVACHCSNNISEVGVGIEWMIERWGERWVYELKVRVVLEMFVRLHGLLQKLPPWTRRHCHRSELAAAKQIGNSGVGIFSRIADVRLP